MVKRYRLVLLGERRGASTATRLPVDNRGPRFSFLKREKNDSIEPTALRTYVLHIYAEHTETTLARGRRLKARATRAAEEELG